MIKSEQKMMTIIQIDRYRNFYFIIKIRSSKSKKMNFKKFESVNKLDNIDNSSNEKWPSNQCKSDENSSSYIPNAIFNEFINGSRSVRH